MNTTHIKKRLINEGRIKDECSICGWNLKFSNAKFSSCELDHIDGDHNNWSRLNLRLLCPSCHSQTDTYKGRNKMRYKKHKLSFWGSLHEIPIIIRRIKKKIMFWGNIVFFIIITFFLIRVCINS